MLGGLSTYLEWSRGNRYFNGRVLCLLEVYTFCVNPVLQVWTTDDHGSSDIRQEGNEILDLEYVPQLTYSYQAPEYKCSGDYPIDIYRM